MQFDSLADVREAEIDDENARRALAYPRLVEALREARIALVMEGHHPGMSAILTDTIDPLLRSLGESE
jgi:hypothetical protein